MNSDFKDLLQLLEKSKVKYLLIGGYAVMHYSEPRYTKDLDIWIEASEDNARKIFSVLKAFGAPIEALSESDFSKEGYFYQMGVPPVRIDILMSVSGLSFHSAWENKNRVFFADLEVNIISKEDLILAKKKAGRPQDLVDLESLQNKTLK